MKARARSRDAIVSGAAWPLVCIKAFTSATCSLIWSPRSAGVPGSVAICERARMSWTVASTSAERASDRWPALPHKAAAFDQSGLSAVMCQQLRLALGCLGELAFNCFGNACMKRAAGLAQQRAIGRVPHQGMLEQVSRIRRQA